MGKNKKRLQAQQQASGRKPQSRAESSEQHGNTLGDLLSQDVLGKLKTQADELKKAQAEQEEQKRLAAIEAKKREQKAKENDFAYLLENSDPNTGKYK
ncbi:DUF3886 domain-containing protein [Paenibacillus sp. HB172176]|uniref:DUF3886 domain-containing protein n=1 Tax=Paenibacillus sp. HB172176 TaxID=2493690 RepID=UPI00143BA443|nr:DUF3886 domain-containing protein [Paenibacillus sp. HB172176]